jgi:Protein of unknown function (DUF4232)
MRFPAPGWSGGAAIAGPIVPAGAVALIDCGYDYPKPKNGKKTFPRGPMVGPRIHGAMTVSGYALTIDQQRPVGATCRAEAVTPRSAGQGAQDALVFTYPDGRTLTLDEGGQCRAIAGPDARTVTSDFQGESALDGLDLPFSMPDQRSKRAADIVGMTVTQATRRGAILTVDAELLDPHLPLGTVLVQSPAAGQPTSEGRQVDVDVAVRRGPICTAHQLRATYTGGGAGAGTAFAFITVRDASRASCTLQGPLRVTALDSDGSSLASNVISVKGTALAPFVLTAAATARSAYDGSALVAETFLSSTDYAGNCTGPAPRPASWRIDLLGRQTGDTGIVATPYAPKRLRGTGGPPIIVCDGKVGAGPATLPGALQLR